MVLAEVVRAVLADDLQAASGELQRAAALDLEEDLVGDAVQAHDVALDLELLGLDAQVVGHLVGVGLARGEGEAGDQDGQQGEDALRDVGVSLFL